jgi:nucleoside-diphosphate-sugar epimerase
MSVVLVTGAAGSLGRVVVPELARLGHTVRQLDQREANPEHEQVRGDVRDPAVVGSAMTGADAVVHAAAIHGIHLDRFTPADFWDLDATGTFTVYDAARRRGVPKIVLCSSMAVYGRSAERTESGWATVDDESAVLPADAYGVAKHAAETLAADAARTWGIETVALRLGMFVPETFERYGFRLLFGGVDDRDVAQATLLALDHRPREGFDTFNVFAQTAFTTDEAGELADEPWAVIERHFPGTVELAESRGLDRDDVLWGWAIWSSAKAYDVLGYRPEYDFDRFLASWRADDPSLYPFADLPRWASEGV